MKKISFFLFCISILMIGCSDDDPISNSSSSNKSENVRWYGGKNIYHEALRGVADEVKLWNPQQGIAIKFINSPADPAMIEKVKSIAAEWENYAGIKFNYVDNTQNAAVRIAFDWNGNDWLTWSYTGTDARFVKSQSQPTAVLGGLEYLDEESFKGDVLRLFGQILGLEYEQRHQNWTFWRSEDKLQSYWEDMFDGMDMDWSEIREYVFTPLSGDNAIYPTQTDEIDELSIMAWPYYIRTQTTKLLENTELSEGDKAFIGKLYPKVENGNENENNQEQSSTTIQKAWIDAGYFKWNSSKTGLLITELGRSQESLPDVSDGEQLTTAFQMFYNSNIKKAPVFNTSNITNMGEMFANCKLLTSVPVYNTSKVQDFTSFFYGCKALTSAPALNTSAGFFFTQMFAGSAITTIPTIDTSTGGDFGAMFEGCSSLTSIPALNTSNGYEFSAMFKDCSSLATIPALKTSNGIEFFSMFEGCSSLTAIPLLDTSKGTSFHRMFKGCSLLKSIPALNTSNGTTFQDMFLNCASLSQKPNLDLSKAMLYENMYGGTPFAN